MPLGRLALLDWRLPHCESGAASVMYAKQSSEGPGWVQTDDDVQLAVAAWRDGTLQAERFAGPPSPERRPRPFHGHGAAFNRMYGVRRSKQEEPVPFHQCNPSPAVSPYDPNCPHPSVRVERLEAFVLATIRERLLEAGAEERIREAILRAKRRDATKVSRDERHLADLRRKIERGTENLALADHDDFAGISKLLTRWREEEAVLVERMEQRGRELEPLPEALRVLARFADVPRNLAKADRAKLAHALRQTVSAITIGVRDAKCGKITYRELHGELTFHEAFGLKPVAIPDEAIGQRRIWRELGELVRKAKQPLHLKDFCQHIGTKEASHAAYHVRQAEKAGLMKKIGHYGGRVAMG